MATSGVEGGEEVFNVVIKVGYANEYTEEKGGAYEELFDVVVDGREGMEWIEGLVKDLKGEGERG